jgi:hypothetical protein
MIKCVLCVNVVTGELSFALDAHLDIGSSVLTVGY